MPWFDFSRPYGSNEAKDYYLKKRAKDGDNVFLTTRRNHKGKNVIDYDAQAIQGYREVLAEKYGEIHDKKMELQNKLDNLPSGSNFFVRIGGSSGKVNRAKRDINNALEQLTQAQYDIKKRIADMDFLPVLTDKVEKKFTPLRRKKASAGTPRAVNANIFKTN